MFCLLPSLYSSLDFSEEIQGVLKSRDNFLIVKLIPKVLNEEQSSYVPFSGCK